MFVPNIGWGKKVSDFLKVRPSTSIYCIVIHTKTRKHICLNRRYELLPVHLPKQLLTLVPKIACRAEVATCHGHIKGQPIGTEKLMKPEHCITYWLYNDGCRPNFEAFN